MNKVDYLNKLKSLLREDQLKFYYRLFPGGVDFSIDNAIKLVERTLKQTNDVSKDLTIVLKKLDKLESDNAFSIAQATEHKNENSVLTAKIKSLQEEKPEAPFFNLTLKEVIRKLHVLEALEQGGVDNWQWFGESLDNYGIE